MKFLPPGISKVRLLLLILLMPVSWVHAQEKSRFQSKEVVQQLDMFIQNMMDSVGVPGLSLAVIENDKIILYKTYGRKQNARNSAVNKRTVFEACSLSKSLLAYVAHQLVDEGKLDLHKPVYQYLPNKNLEYDPRYKKITARMILSHNSGIENWQAMNNPDTLEIISEPGKKFVYSGEGYNYLAKVIAEILQQPYGEYIKERVVQPLQLNRTFLHYKKRKLGWFGKNKPGNYAVGSDLFGNVNDKWINLESLPSSAVSLTAKDYANLLIAMFNNRHLSAERRWALREPVVRVNDIDSTLFISEGFEVCYSNDGDTIISHDGDNPGFKGAVFYSAVSKNGFVFFTNSDRGFLLAKRLNELTWNLAIANIFERDYYRQYPNDAIALFKIYRDEGEEAMFAALQKLKSAGKLNPGVLNQLGDEFLEYGAISEKIVDLFLASYPASALANQLKGELFIIKNEMDSALVYLGKAKELDPANLEIQYEYDYSKENLNTDELAGRRSRLTEINRQGYTTIEAEDYNAMYATGKRDLPQNDTSEGCCANFITTGHWLDYKVAIPVAGSWEIKCRVTSFMDSSRLSIRSGSAKLAAITIPVTKFDGWTTIRTTVQLPAGPQVIRLFAVSGRVDINWWQLQPVQQTVKNQ